MQGPSKLLAPVVMCGLVLGCLVWPRESLAQAKATQTYQQVIPYTPIGEGAPVIDVVFNGNVKARMLVDSGAGVSGITDELAEKLGVANSPSVQLPHGPLILGGKKMRLVMVARMDIDKFYFHDSPFVILDSRQLSAVGAAVDGVIGADSLTVFPAMFDFQSHEITFYSQSLSQSDLKAIGMGDAAAVPLTEHGENFLFSCPVDLGSGEHRAETDLQIDTGGAYTVLCKDTAKALNILPGGPVDQYPTYGEVYNVTPAVIEDISIGGVHTKYQSVYYANDNPPADQPLPLGLDVLSHYRILLDFGKKVMYVKPADDTTEPAVPTVTLKSRD